MDGQANITEFTDGTEKANEPETVRLKHLARINPTKSELSDLDLETDVSFVPLEDFGTDGEIKDTETRALEEVYDGYTYFREGDIAIAKITPSFENGKGAICRGLENGIGFGTTELHILRPRKGVNTEFLWYVLQSKSFINEAETAMRGVAGQQRVPAEMIENFEAPIFDKHTQTKISDYLNRWSSKLDSLVELINNFSAKIDEHTTSTITSTLTRGVKNKQLVNKNSRWFGDLPADWDITRVKFLITDIEQGWSPQCNEIPASGNQWGVLKTGCVNHMSFDSTENKQLPADLDPKPELEVKHGDVMMSRANTRELVGSCAIAESPDPKLILCDKLYRFDVDDSVCLPRYLVYALNASFARNQIELDASGASSSMVNISQEFVGNMQLPLPPLNEQKQIIQFLNQKTRRNNEIQRCTTELVDLLHEKHEALITQAVTNQIDFNHQSTSDT